MRWGGGGDTHEVGEEEMKMKKTKVGMEEGRQTVRDRRDEERMEGGEQVRWTCLN